MDGVSRVCTSVSAGMLAVGGGPDSGFEAGGESTASWGQGVRGGGACSAVLLGEAF